MLLFQLSSNPDMMRNLLISSIALLTLSSFLARDRAVSSTAWERFAPSLLQVKTLCASSSICHPLNHDVQNFTNQ
jgi:hypothetical protein